VAVVFEVLEQVDCTCPAVLLSKGFPFTRPVSEQVISEILKGRLHNRVESFRHEPMMLR
jgi:hypothetical protein